MKALKTLLVLCVLSGFGAAIAGCEAQAKVGDTDSHGGTVYKKETTTVRDPVTGNTETKTEVKTSTP